MSSGFGPPLVAIVGLAVIFRRGWRPALYHTLPLATVYVVWWLSSHTVSLVDKSYPSLEIFVQWVVIAVSGAFLALGGYPVVAVGLGVLLVTGLMLAWAPLSLPLLRQQASLHAAMLVGAVALQVVICTQRWPMILLAGLDIARSGRYIVVSVALALPALAAAADAVVRRWQWMMPVVCALFLVGIGLNTTRFVSNPVNSSVTFAGSRAAMLALAYSPLAEQAPPDLIPYPHKLLGGHVDMAFLLEARDSGRLPNPPTMTAALKSQTELRLALQQLPGPIPEALSCMQHADAITLNPKVGDLYGLTTSILISLGETGTPLTYNTTWQLFPVIRILRPNLTLRFSPMPPATSFGLCF